ncbi:hypothetical protein [Gorillibacterium sp. CAU 1737]|uniref:hypothetical protein n=1 Tax=Gorillibacterium sp. CAU 1737 TaxID=3140362 RepID=UPI0032608306
MNDREEQEDKREGEGLDELGELVIAEDEEELEQEPIPFRLPPKIALFLVAVVGLTLYCSIQLPKTMKEYKVYKQAEALIEKGETSAAISNLDELSNKYPDSTDLSMKLLRLSMQEGYYSIAVSTINDRLYGQKLFAVDHERFTGYIEQLERHLNAQAAVSGFFPFADDQANDEAPSRDEVKAQIYQLLDQSDMDQAYLYYVLSGVEEDLDTILWALQESYELDPELAGLRVKLSVICRRMDRLEEASQYAEEALRKERRDVEALRAMSTIKLATGDLSEGLRYSEEAYRLNPDAENVLSTYAVALYANGEYEMFRSILDDMANKGESPEGNLRRYFNGDMSLQDYYIEKRMN